MRLEGCRGEGVRLSLRSVAAIGDLLQGQSMGWLSDAEQTRLETLRSVSRRAQFLAGRWLARSCLADGSGTDWQDWRLSAPQDGAPEVIDGPHDGPLNFSISHSGDWVACAVAKHPVGVDVERCTRTRDFAALAQWLHPASALHKFTTLDADEQQRLFYTHWTLKEAWLKQARNASMRTVQFAQGAAPDQGRFGQGEGVCVALYPATATQTVLCEPLLRTMAWSDWACTPLR